MKYFYKLITYYMIDYNNSSNTRNIKRQVVGYIMSLEKNKEWNLRQIALRRINIISCSTTWYHPILIFYGLLLTRDVVLNANEYNYNLRNVIGQEDEYKVTKWTWLNKQVCNTLLSSWMISRKLVDHTNIGRAIGRLLNLVYAPSVGMRNSVGSATTFFCTSMVVHPGSDDHLYICKFIHNGLLSSLLKKQQNGKFHKCRIRIWLQIVNCHVDETIIYYCKVLLCY